MNASKKPYFFFYQDALSLLKKVENSQNQELIEKIQSDIESLNENFQQLIIENKFLKKQLSFNSYETQRDTVLSIIENTNSCLASFNEKGQLIAFNTAYAQAIFDMEMVEVRVGIHFLEKLALHRKLFWKQLFDRAVSGEQFKEEITYEIENSTIYIQLVFNPILKNGKVVGFTKFMYNLTEQKRIESEFREAKLQAESANRAKTEFLANMSHEIRTPMNAILGFADILHQRLEEQPETKELIKGIQVSGKNLLSIINDILDLSKIEAGRMDIVEEPCDIYRIIKELEQVFSLKINQKGLKFDIEIDPDLPKILLLDELRVQQILFNLISNAIKFTPQGAIKISIEGDCIVNQPDQIQLTIEIQDTGIGIPISQQDAIFEPFKQQEGQNTRRYGGTGLGLSITKRLVEMMNGTIMVQSEKNQGSIFTIKLHSVKVPQQTMDIEMQEGIDIKNIDFMRSKLLIIDDAGSNRLLISECLKPHNIQVFEAENGCEALHKTFQIEPNIVFIDLEMVMADIYRTVEKIRQRLPNVIILMITSQVPYGKESLEIEHVKKYSNGCLVKPFVKSDLIKLLTDFLPYTFKENASKTMVVQAPTQQIAKETLEHLPDFISELETHYQTTWEEILEKDDFEYYSNFTSSLLYFGKQNGLIMVSEYAEQLRHSVDSFDIDTIKQTLDAYPQLISQLKHYYKEQIS